MTSSQHQPPGRHGGPRPRPAPTTGRVGLRACAGLALGIALAVSGGPAARGDGGHWARHWLDVARYADASGFEADHLYPNAWRYRDYVIRSLNAGKPFDRFIREQVAGDELWPDDPEAVAASTLYCVGPAL